MTFRGAVAAWAELLECLRQGEPVAATTAELDALWSTVHGDWPRCGKRIHQIMGHRVVEVREW